jgi:hypothetical protein
MPRRNPRQDKAQRTKEHRRDAPGDAFRCVGCKLDVPFAAPGTAHRNHCPHCLTSVHVDRRVPGDRRERCHGRMTALCLSVRQDGEWLIIHHCVACGSLSSNRVAGDDNALLLLRMAMRPFNTHLPKRALMAL